MAPRATNTTISASSTGHGARSQTSLLEKNSKDLTSNTSTTPESLQAKQPSSNINNDSRQRRVSIPILFRSRFSFSSPTPTNEEQAQVDTQQSPLETNGEDSFERRRSLRASISTKISTLTSKLSSSPSAKTQRAGNTDQSQSLESSSTILRDISRPTECLDRTELDYIRERNMAEQQRGKVFAEDEYSLFEMERAVAAPTGEGSSNAEIFKFPPRTSSLPRNARSDAVSQHERAQSAPSITQRLSGVDFTPLLRTKSRMAMRKAFLRQSPAEWNEYDVPEAEYYLQIQQIDQLSSAFNQVIEHEECASKYGLCEHQYKGRASEKHDENGRRIKEVEEEEDQGRDGEWHETMEEALAAEEDEE